SEHDRRPARGRGHPLGRQEICLRADARKEVTITMPGNCDPASPNRIIGGPPMKTLKLLAASLAMSLALPTLAAHAFPDGPVTVIVPFGAGGGTDAVARVLADAMSRTMGGDFIVDNRGGANGAIGASAVAMA